MSNLKQKQALPLSEKIKLTQELIRDWYSAWDGNVYVSFSGGKDSTVLLDIARSIFPDIPAVFMDTGLEFPEIRQFVKQTGNVVWLRPKKSFRDVTYQYGWPVVSKEVSQNIYEIRNTKSEYLINKRLYGGKNGKGKLAERWKFLVGAPFRISGRCCYHLKKSPVISFEKKTKLHPITGLMAGDSRLRGSNFIRNGCNAYDTKRPTSAPLSVWTESDIWGYIHQNNLKYSSIYDMGYGRTGCMFCMFGLQYAENNKFQQMAKTHPKHWNYCINKLGCGEVLDYIRANLKNEKLAEKFNPYLGK